MTDIYVSPTGNDNAAADRAHPLRTVDKARQRRQKGDTIYLLPGTYPPIEVTAAETGFRLVGIGDAVIDAELDAPCGFLTYANWTSIWGVTVKNGVNSGISAHEMHHLYVRNCKVSGCIDGIYAMGCGDTLIENCDSSYNGRPHGGCGISIHVADDNKCSGDPFPVRIIGNTLTHNAQTENDRPYHTEGQGIALDGSYASRPDIWTWGFFTKVVLIQGNTMTGNGGPGFASLNYKNFYSLKNTIYGNRQDPLSDRSGEVVIWGGLRSTFEGDHIAAVETDHDLFGLQSANRMYIAYKGLRTYYAANPGQPGCHTGGEQWQPYPKEGDGNDNRFLTTRPGWAV